jgi:NADPH:quinone reductase-like Zn-dependent oxidoreductase
MRAATCRRYGPPEVIALEELPTPAPRRGEVLVAVRAAEVSSGDRRVRALDVPAGYRLPVRLAFGWSGPRQPVLGVGLAGVVAAVGPGVTAFRAGDEVIADVGLGMGCHAEYRCVREDAAMVPRPASLAFEAAAALLFGGSTALAFLRRAGLRAGERLLVNGAAGAVGTAAVQLARELGAEVTAVCSAGNAELVRSLGAGRVVDYAREDFAAGSDRYEVVLDAVGNAPLGRSRRALVAGGRFLAVVATLAETLAGPLAARLAGLRFVGGSVQATAEDLRHLASLAEAGRFRPAIDRVFPLDAVVEAHRRVDCGRKRGSVVLSMG